MSGSERLHSPPWTVQALPLFHAIQTPLFYALLYSRPKRQPPSLTAYSPIQSTFPLWGFEADEDKVVGDEEWALDEYAVRRRGLRIYQGLGRICQEFGAAVTAGVGVPHRVRTRQGAVRLRLVTAAESDGRA